MMGVVVRCEWCGAQYSAREDLVGQEVACLQCGRAITVADGLPPVSKRRGPGRRVAILAGAGVCLAVVLVGGVFLLGRGGSPPEDSEKQGPAPPASLGQRTVTIPGEPRTVDSRGIVTVQVRSYRGQGDPEAAVRAVLRQIPWAVSESAVYDKEAGKVHFYHDRQGGPGVNMRLVETAMGGAGFEVAGQSFCSFPSGRTVSVGPDGVDPPVDAELSGPSMGVVASAGRRPSRPASPSPSGSGGLQSRSGQISLGPSTLKLPADPAPGSPAGLPDRPVMIVLPKPDAKVVMPSTPSPLAAIGTSGFTTVEGRSTQVWRFELWDLSGPSRLGAMEAPMAFPKMETGLSRSCALSSEGRLLALQRSISARDPDQNAKIDLWSFASGGLAHTLDLGERARVLFTGFAGPDHLVTVHCYWPEKAPPDLHRHPELLTPKLRRWSVASGELVNEFKLQVPDDQTGEPTGMALSPGGRYAAVVQRHLWVYELATGKVAAQTAIPDVESPHRKKPCDCHALSFSNDGTLLGGLFKPFHEQEIHLIVWDVVAGRIRDAIELEPGFQYGASAMALRGRHALSWLPDGIGWTIFGEAVVDERSGNTVWQAQRERPGQERWMPDDVHLAEMRRINQQMTLVVAPLPLEAIRQRQASFRGGGWEEDILLPPIIRPAQQLSKAGIWSSQPEPLKLDCQPVPAPDRPYHEDAFPVGEAPVAAVHFARPDVGQAVAWHATLRDPLNVNDKLFNRPSKEEPNWLTRVDLFTGEELGELELPPGSGLLGFTPDGALAVTRSGDSFTRVDVWALVDGSHVASWRPFTSGGQPEEKISPFEVYPTSVLWAGFPDSEHLITVQAETGDTIVWNVSQPAAIAKFTSDAKTPPVFSADHRYLLFDRGDKLRILDCHEWRTVGDLDNAETEPLEYGYYRRFAFHPSQPLLACVFVPSGSDARVRVWDLREGKMLSEIPYRKTNEPPYWGPGARLWVHQSWGPFSLLDPRRHGAVYSFTASGTINKPVGSSPQGTVWLCTRGDGDRPVYLKHAGIPRQETLDEIDAQVPLDRKPIFGPGTRATIVIEEFNVAEAPGDLRNKVVAVLEEKLRAVGAQPAPGQPIRLALRVRRGKGSEERYVSGPPRNRRKVAVTRDQYLCNATMRDEANTLIWSWRTSVMSGPSAPWYKVPEGTDPQAHLQEMSTKFASSSVISGFRQVKLPKRIYAPIFHGPAKMPGLGTKMVDLSLPPPEPASRTVVPMLARYQRERERKDWLLPILGGPQAIPDPSTLPRVIGVSPTGAAIPSVAPTTPRAPGVRQPVAAVPSPVQGTAAYPGFGSSGGEGLEKAARDYRRSVYVDLIAGEDSAVVEKLRWLSGSRRPAIGIRWGVGIEWTASTPQPSIRDLQDFVKLTGPIGSGVFEELDRRIADGKFGPWPKSDDGRIGPPVFLGFGNETQLAEAAKRHAVDAVAVVELTTRGSGARIDPALQIRLMDATTGEVLWKSKVIRKSTMARGPEGLTAVRELGDAFQAALDGQFSLVAMPEIQPEHAKGRVDALREAAGAMPLSAVVELRYYLAKKLISRDLAVEIFDAILGTGRGTELLDGDEPRRREILEAWLSESGRQGP